MKSKILRFVFQALFVVVVSFAVAKYVHQDNRLIRPEEFIGKSRVVPETLLNNMFPKGSNVDVFRFVMLQSGMKEEVSSGKQHNKESVGSVVFRHIDNALWHFWGEYWVVVVAEYDKDNKIVTIRATANSRGL